MHQLEFDFETPAQPNIWEGGIGPILPLLVKLQDQMNAMDHQGVRKTTRRLRAVLGNLSVIAVNQLRKSQRSGTT
jgi:hypothetical protein